MTDTPPTSPAAAPRKKISIGKLLLRAFLAIVLIIIVSLIALYAFRNSFVRAGVERGGKHATDLNTALTEADLSLSGSLKLNTLEMDNVKGFTGKLLVMKSCSVTVSPSSLLTSTVDIPDITINGLEITVEQNGLKNNVNELLAAIEKKTPVAGTSENKSPGKSLKIGTLKLTGTKVHIRGIVTRDFDLSDVEMKNPTNPDGRDMKIADLIGKILLQVTKQILDDPNLPGNFKDSMKNANAIVDRGNLDKDRKLIESGGLKEAGKTLENLNPFGKKKDKP